MKRKQPFRFTLIEAIVIVVIILILVAVIIPVLTKIKENGKRTVCKNNLRIIGIAISKYGEVEGYSDRMDFPHKSGRAGLQMLAKHKWNVRWDTYVCPSTNDSVSNESEILTNSSYAYAPGFTEMHSSDHAIASDRANNHSKYGNILFVGHRVKGYSGANWSSNFGDSVLGDFK